MTNKYIPIVFLFAAVLLIPGGAFASNNSLEEPNDYDNNYYDENKLESDFDELPNEMAENIKTNETILQKAHSDVTNYMIMANDSELDPEEYTGPDIDFTMVYIDDDTLVVGLDPLLAHPDYTIPPEIIQEVLNIDLPVEVKYIALEDEMSSSRKASIIKQYKRDCMPILPAKSGVCQRLVDVMTREGITIPGSTIKKTSPKPIITGFKAKLSGDDAKLSWNAENTSKMKYYKLYISENYGSYKYKTKLSKSSESYTVSDLNDGKTYKFKLKAYYTDSNRTKNTSVYSNKITTPVDVPPVIVTINNLNARQMGDDVKLSWDKPLGVTIQYYKVYASEGGSYYKYKGFVQKNTSSFILDNVDDGQTYKFKLKVYYLNENNKTSVKYFYSNTVDVPRIIPDDTIPPVVTVPNDMSFTSTTDAGMIVTYTASARDNTDGNLPVTCSRISGATFPVDTTTVTCTATDAAENVGSASFVVTVTYDEPEVVVDPEPEFEMYYGGTKHKVHFWNATLGDNDSHYGTITFGATTNDDVPGMVTSGHAVMLTLGDRHLIYLLGGDNHDVYFTDAIATATNSGNVDAGFTPITDPSVVVSSTQIEKRDGSKINIVQGALADVEINQPLFAYGVNTNGEGTLLYNNVTSTWPNILGTETVFFNMAIGDYGTVGGDSGAPIVHYKDGQAYLVGVNKGTLCSFNPELPDVEEINVSGDTEKCPRGDSDNWHYKIFSSWENVKAKLDLQ